jgi:hypothetical protein
MNNLPISLSTWSSHLSNHNSSPTNGHVEDKNTRDHDHDRHVCSMHIITHDNVIAIHVNASRRATPSGTTASD